MAIKKIRMRPEGTNDYGDILHPETSADVVKLTDPSNHFTATTVEGAMAELFQNDLAIESGVIKIITSTTEPTLDTGDYWYKEV